MAATVCYPKNDPNAGVISSLTLYRRRPILLSLDVAPFIFVYGAWGCVWASVGGDISVYVGLGVCVLIEILMFLSTVWSVDLNCFFRHFKESDLNIASLVKVTPSQNNGKTELIPLHRVKVFEEEETAEKNDEIRYFFIFQKVKYVIKCLGGGGGGEACQCPSGSHGGSTPLFTPLSFPTTLSHNQYLSSKGHESEEKILKLRRKFGPNVLEMEVPEFMHLFKERATAPFFVFQVFCVCLWCLDEYWYYSLFTLFMLVVFECTLVQQQQRNMAEIRRMGAKPYHIQAYRGRRWKLISTSEIVPGDILSVKSSSSSSSGSSSSSSGSSSSGGGGGGGGVHGGGGDLLVPCDLLLLRGNCIVDESILTGESVPQMKEGIEQQQQEQQQEQQDGGGNNNESNNNENKLNILFAGTKIIQHTPPLKTSTAIRASDNGVVCYALRTGFGSVQGRLVKTILYGVTRVTENTLETLLFILTLLVFAVVAASYVWIKGTADPDRNRYKLFLECSLILTSVVPPELPIELSLAVNNSLLSLSKLLIFCTEPFRIPFAGKVDVACFDKTGTLTSDVLLVEGVTSHSGSSEIIPLSQSSLNTIQVLASCHSLVQMSDGLIGDPQEKAVLNALDWSLSRDPQFPSVAPKRGGGVRIVARYHFTSQLRRMAVVSSCLNVNSEYHYFVGVKGAPETIKDRLVEVPEDYDRTFNLLSARGARILALARKELGTITHAEVRCLKRDDIENNLNFCGFLVISCPLKKDSKEVIRQVIESSHACTMITGDNYQTACHVASVLHITRKPAILVLKERVSGGGKGESEWGWQELSKDVWLPLRSPDVQKYDLCLTGEGLAYLQQQQTFVQTILCNVRVFARVKPKEKECIINEYKSLGLTTMMVGDGTNDMGALKHANIGVAILSSGPERMKRERERRRKRERESMSAAAAMMDSGDERVIVKLGDASIAAPFTYKLSSTNCVVEIIKQGRCTLVTTLQMFKILALNALILAYSQSVLYLEGVKFSDYQATLQGLLLAGCFLFVSRAKPLQTLSKRRPLPNIFNAQTLSTLLLQFTCHLATLIYLVTLAYTYEPRPDKIDVEKEFEPNLLNSTVYIISLSLQVFTFAINYRGPPFMQSLRDNTPLLYSLAAAALLALVLIIGIFPDFSHHFEIINFPHEFQLALICTLSLDFSLSLTLDRLTLALFGEGSLAQSLRV